MIDEFEDDKSEQEQVIWAPQPGGQEMLIHCPVTLIGLGGSRGGGKTDGVLGRFAIDQQRLGEDFNAIFFRKELPQADDLIERAKQIYMPLGAHWQDQKKQFTFRNGARVRFRPLGNDDDAQKYQGQNLCVVIGTRIRMADGTFKAIQKIKQGEYVATLMGPKKVLAKTRPYKTDCVENLVLGQDGNVVGVQRNPISHPVLTAHGVFSTSANYEQHKSQIPHIDERSRQWVLSACSVNYKFHAYKDLKNLAWFSYSKDNQIYCRESLDDILDRQRPPRLCVPVTLHAPTLQSIQKQQNVCPCAANESFAQRKSYGQLLDSYLDRQRKYLDQQQQSALSPQSQDENEFPVDDVANARSNYQTVADFQVDCRCGLCFYGEYSPQVAKTSSEKLPLLIDAVEQSRRLHEDELDTIQTHIPERFEWWVHPYTGEACRLREDVVFGKMEVSYIGKQWVSDLTIEDANHYITDCGLVNKNSCVAVEEAGNYSDPSPIWKMFGALRGKGGGQIILTFNPGGAGHHWLKELFIKPWPQGRKILYKELPNGKKFDYIYIPSRVYENPILLAKDPGYIDRLHMVGSPELVRAWLEGDFEIHEGSYFPEFSSKHIIAPFNIPKHWPRYLGYDWGYRSPFAAVWGAVSSGKDDKGREVPYPRGAIIIYREAWGKGVDNVAQADKIASLSVGENPIAVADPSIFSHEGGPSINDQFSNVFAKYKHPNFRAADNDRISGWSQIRQRLIAKPPLLYIFASCPYLIETLPALTIDKRKAEDADSSGNDHACDALRYLCKERLIESPWEPPKQVYNKGRVKLQAYVDMVRGQMRRAKI